MTDPLLAVDIAVKRSLRAIAEAEASFVRLARLYYETLLRNAGLPLIPDDVQ